MNAQDMFRSSSFIKIYWVELQKLFKNCWNMYIDFQINTWKAIN